MMRRDVLRASLGGLLWLGSLLGAAAPSATQADESVVLAGGSVRAGVIEAGRRHGALEIPFEGGTDLSFVVVCTVPFAVTVVTPGGVEVDAGNAGQHGAQFESFRLDEPLGLPAPGFGVGEHVTVDFSQAQAGTYEVRIALGATAQEPTPFTIFATSAGSSVRAGLGIPEPESLPGRPVVLVGFLFDGETPIVGATFSAAVVRAEDMPGVVEPAVVPLEDDGREADETAGDGLYSGLFVPTQAGSYFVEAKASGTSAHGRPFERVVAGRFRAAERTARLVGPYSSRGVDDDGNGLFNRLVIDLGIEAPAGARLDVGLVLKGSGGKTAVSNVVVDSTGGHQTVHLGFSAEEVRSLLADGPFELVDLRIDELTDAARILRDRLDHGGVTEAFRRDAFEHEGISLTGVFFAGGVDRDGDAKFDVLRVTIGVELVQGGFHQWSARLVAPDNTELGFAAGSGDLDAGTTAIAVEFDGCGIGAHGRNGPYVVRDLLISGPLESFVGAETVGSASYRVSDFECAPAMICVGDCNEDGQVTVDELVRGVGIALGTQLVSACPVFDRNGDQAVTVDELVAAVARALEGCEEAGPTPTTAVTTPTRTQTWFGATATPTMAVPTPSSTRPPDSPSATHTGRPTATTVPPASRTPTRSPTRRVYCEQPASPPVIPDDDPFGVSSTLTVEEDVRIRHLRVSVRIDHTWVGDLVVELVRVGEMTSVMLLDRPGLDVDPLGCGGSGVDCVFDDSAFRAADDLCDPEMPAIQGEARPSGTLDGFAGQSAAGQWLLILSDHAPRDDGRLVRWCLEIDTG